MCGQQVDRCRHVFDAYDQRKLVVGVNLNMHNIEVLLMERHQHEIIQVTTTGPVPFSIDPASPGFQLLAQVLLTPKAYLGFVTARLPDVKK